MNLICGKQYKVTIRMRKWFVDGKKHETYYTLPLEYCGGSIVDDEGHYMSRGVWCHPASKHPNYLYFDNLDVMGIVEMDKPAEPFWKCFTKKEVREYALLYGRNWRTILLEHFGPEEYEATLVR